MAPKHVLVTGFEPFGDDKVNPSELVVRALEGRLIAGRPLVTYVFPVETRSLRGRLEPMLVKYQPEVVIALGQASGRSAMALERVAVNLLDFQTHDNLGVVRKGEQVVSGGPDARLSNLPFERILDSWRQNGVPGYTSNSAGTFLCNQLFYELLARAESAEPPTLVGFIHLPYLPAQAIAAGPESNPSMSFEVMKKGIELLIETVVPWVEQRTPETTRTRAKGQQMWIPRGVKEIER